VLCASQHSLLMSRFRQQWNCMERCMARLCLNQLVTDRYGIVNAGAALYTAYRDSDTIFNSSDLVSGLFEYMRKGGGTGSIEVRHRGVHYAACLLPGPRC
jgi:hypothetical protein